MAIKQNLNLDWKFHLGDAPGADFMGYNDAAWRRVTLPHDWAVEQPFDREHASGTGYLPGGTAWYRKHFTLPQDVAGKRVRVTFGGVYKHPRVWINSNYLGARAYGYTTFTYDLSDFVRPGENVLCVRVEHNDVADSRWFTGSGIYRDVTLEISDRRCFETDGVFVSTQQLMERNSTAILDIQYDTLDCDGAIFQLLDDAGRVCGETRKTGEHSIAEMRVENARLWSPESPYLYTVACLAQAQGQTTDELRIPVGIRTIQFDPDKGFFLNGRNRKLLGVCVHHDGGALGAAVPKAVWARRLRALKAAGCNALRTAHNPPDPALLDLCDEMGFLVMDEAFDEWEGIKNKWWQGHNVYPPKHFGYGEDFPQWHRFDLEAMVKRDRNHPCVILWSIGNEIDYPNDPYVTPLFKEVLGNNDANKPAAERIYDVRKPDAGRLAALCRELTHIVHDLDTTRPVTSAMSFPELSTRTGYADALDASGYNYKEEFYEADHARFPDRVIYGSENGHSIAAWKAVLEHDYICGQFLWTGVDFLGECRGWPLRISQAGLLDLAGYPKPLYYQRKALWTKAPFVKLSVSDHEGLHGLWMERFAWQGEEGEKRYVAAATNGNAVELFLNGVSLGRKEVSLETGCRAVWEVPYAPGQLRAVADGAEDTLYTPGPAAEISLQADKNVLTADGQDVAQVEVSLLDAADHPAGNDLEITYQVLGDAQILGIENGKPDDLTPYASPSRQTFQGRAILYLRVGVTPGEIRLHAFTRGGLQADCIFQAK